MKVRLVLAAVAVALLGVGCGSGDESKLNSPPITAGDVVSTTTTTPPMPTTTTTVCSTDLPEAIVAKDTDFLSIHQAEYDSLKALSGPNSQRVSDLEYFLGTADRDVERARVDLAQATADIGTARTWEEYEQGKEMEAAAQVALVEAEAYRTKLQGDLARAKAGDPITNQRLSTLSQRIKEGQDRIATAKAEIAQCQAAGGAR